MWRDDDDSQSKCLKHKVEEFQYPPKMRLDICYDERKAVSEMITFTVHFTGIQDTTYSKACDKAIHLYARSNWFRNNHLSKCAHIIIILDEH